MFRFGVQIKELFKFNVTTKMIRLMLHVHHHLVHLCFICRVSSEENEMVHKEFIILYNATNKHVNSTCQHIVTSWIDLSLDQPRPFLPSQPFIAY